MKVKKIAALAVGAAMLGATMGFASAVHTSDTLPAEDFFVKSDGTPNVKIVVGSQGAAQDVVAAADIAVAIGTLLYNEKEVEVTGPAVFKELPHVEETLPVYNSGRLVAPDMTTLESEAANYWWNGEAYSTTYDNYVGSWYADLGYYEKILNENVDDWITELDNTPYNAWAKVGIGAILVDLGDEDKPYPTGDELIYIPAGNFTYTAHYDQRDYYYATSSYSGCCEYIPGEKVRYIADPGIQAGDSFTFLGQKYHAVCVYGSYSAGLDLATICPTCEAIGASPYVLLLATDVIEGQDGWVSVGGTLTVGPNDEYTINVLDINIVGTEKVLLKVTDNTGVRPTATVGIEQGSAMSIWGDYDGDGDDDLVITLYSTFIGVQGNTQARLLVYTDLKPVASGDLWPSSDWVVSFHGLVNTDGTGWREPTEVGDGWNWTGIIELNSDCITGTCEAAVDIIQVTNRKKIGPAKTLSIPMFDPLYNITYSSDICGPLKCEDKTNDDYGSYVYSGSAWIDIVKVGRLRTYNMEVGETLNDVFGYPWTFDDYPYYMQLDDLGKVKTMEPVKVTTPITMLDTEVMAAGLDSVGSNLILVGGPVVNAVTAALAGELGVPSDYAGWESEYGTGAESAVVQYVESSDTIGGYGVLLVAGTDREGTKAAAEYLMEYLSGL